jgi:hypothetical protein
LGNPLATKLLKDRRHRFYEARMNYSKTYTSYSCGATFSRSC